MENNQNRNLEFVLKPSVKSQSISCQINFENLVSITQTGIYSALNIDIRGDIEFIRDLIQPFRKYEDIPGGILEEVKSRKLFLPVIMVSVSAIQNERGKERCVYSGYSQHDFDIKDNPGLLDPIYRASLIEELFSIPRVRLVAVSPSFGIKVIYYNGLPLNEEHHKLLFAAGKRELEHVSNLIADNISDVVRKMFLTLDPSVKFKIEFDETEFEEIKVECKETKPIKSTDKALGYESIDTNTIEKVESYVQEIELLALDITSDYSDWTKLCFAFCSLGAAGQAYFKRISQFYAGYTESECLNKFHECLRNYDGRITIGTFFHACEKIGLTNIRTVAINDHTKQVMPKKGNIISPHLLNNLSYKFPELINRSMNLAGNPRQKDLVFLMIIAAFASVPKKAKVIHAHKREELNLQIVISALPGSGKGILDKLNGIFEPIVKYTNAVYSDNLARWKEDKEDGRGERPLRSMPLMSIDSSLASFIDVLVANDGFGLLLETEAANLSNVFSKPWGEGLKQLFCKSFHGERHVTTRKGKEVIEHEPKFTSMISGTPQTCLEIFDNRDGLLSRQLIYQFDDKSRFSADAFGHDKIGIHDATIDKLGEEMLRYYLDAQLLPEISFAWEDNHQTTLSKLFDEHLENAINQTGDDFASVINRLALSITRIVSIVYLIELWEDGNLVKQLEEKCFFKDQHAKLAIHLANRFFPHVYTFYKSQPTSKFKINKKATKIFYLFGLLPDIPFTVKELLMNPTIVNHIGQRDTIERYLNQLIEQGAVEKVKHGYYQKINRSRELEPAKP